MNNLLALINIRIVYLYTINSILHNKAMKNFLLLFCCTYFLISCQKDDSVILNNDYFVGTWLLRNASNIKQENPLPLKLTFLKSGKVKLNISSTDNSIDYSNVHWVYSPENRELTISNSSVETYTLVNFSKSDFILKNKETSHHLLFNKD